MPKELVWDLSRIGSRIRRIIVEFSPFGDTEKAKPKVIPIRKDDPKYLGLKQAMTTVTAVAANLNLDSGLDAEDTYYDHALTGFTQAVEAVTHHRGRRGIATAQAMFDTAMNDLPLELPHLQNLQPDHPDLMQWQALMRTHFDNALSQIQNRRSPQPQR